LALSRVIDKVNGFAKTHFPMMYEYIELLLQVLDDDELAVLIVNNIDNKVSELAWKELVRRGKIKL